MLKFLKRSLTPERLEEIEKRVIQEAEAGRDEAALRELQPLIRTQRHQKEAAIRLCRIVERRYLPIETGVTILAEIEAAYSDDVDILAMIGESVEGARDVDQLNIEPPEHPLFFSVVEKLDRAVKEARGLL